MKTLSFLLLCLCLTGCLKSEVLLEDPAKCVIDKKLIGFWSMVDGKKKMITAIGPSKVEGNPAGLICYQQIFFTEEGQLQDDDNGTQPRSEYAFSVRVGNYDYLCTIDQNFYKPGEYTEWLTGKDQTCEIYRYRIDNDQLTLWVGVPDKLRENGLPIETKPGIGGTKTYTGTREEMVEFLKTKSDKLFPDDSKLVFKRITF